MAAPRKVLFRVSSLRWGLVTSRGGHVTSEHCGTGARLQLPGKMFILRIKKLNELLYSLNKRTRGKGGLLPSSLHSMSFSSPSRMEPVGQSRWVSVPMCELLVFFLTLFMMMMMVTVIIR